MMARERHDDTALSAHPRPRVWDLLRGKETVSIHHTTFSVPQEPYVEMHSALEFGVLLSGRLRRLGEGYARVLEPGDVWFQGAWEPHAYELLALPTAALSFGMLPQALLAERLEESAHYDWLAPFVAPPELRPRPPAARRHDFLSLAGRVIGKQSAGPVEAGLWRLIIFLEMMLHAREHWVPPARPSVPPPEAYSRVSRAVGMVLTASQPVSVGEAARACDLSRGAFSRLFKAAIGITFAKYCLRHRLGAAAEQLLRSDGPIKAVANAWGFVDASHFDRCFQKHYACSPLVYRRRARL
jgi:AraC-like DNA-binding protein